MLDIGSIVTVSRRLRLDTFYRAVQTTGLREYFAGTLFEQLPRDLAAERARFVLRPSPLRPQRAAAVRRDDDSNQIDRPVGSGNGERTDRRLTSAAEP